VVGQFGLCQPEHGGEVSLDGDGWGLVGPVWADDDAMDQGAGGVRRLGLVSFGQALV
jgi:hypothetical protein